MLKWIISLLPNKAKEAQNKRELYGLDNLEDDAIGYPPTPIGIPVVQTHVLIERMTEKINAIRNEIGVSREVFDEYILPVFHNFIRYADLLPASEYKHHATGGGLVSHSLDVAHRAMRAAHMTHFPVTTNSLTETQQSNVQWRVGTVLAALLHDGGKILADVLVHDGSAKPSERIVWDAQSGITIHDWAAEHNIERYFITWNRDRHMKHVNASLVVMERLIPSKTWSWLEKCYDGKEVHSMMLASVGKTSLSHPMPQIVAEADSASAKADMFSRNSHITKEIKKVPLSELLCDLMRHYILTGKWKVNEKNSVVWFVGEQLYIVWNNAVPELVEEMVGAGYMIPTVPEVLARLMVEEGQALVGEKDIYSDIYPEILGEPKKPVRIKALKIRNVQRLVLEPEKLYSLKEHQSVVREKEPEKAKTVAATQAKPNEQLIEELFEQQSDVPQPTSASVYPKQRIHESSRETMVRILSNIAVSLRENNKKPKSQEPVETPTPQGGNPQETAINFKCPVPPVNVQREQHEFESVAARFVAERFNFDVKGNMLQIPEEELLNVVNSANEAGLSLSATTLIRNVEIEVV